ncbi:RNA polymerase i-specific transcription initiation factor rrn3-related [Anaeramoeba flamelloides]|uniref:RNA polymerase i-specific transcription initiation factor rrn3-related n=1 Tax=Anaeramoeba flamelloides TaxID=1746091 RepID=A0AAV7ZQ43_9EUKA|nr:RNA polymerase i-specific transcription initiation factor rrn3-related [Anaeramoeba flamelloides]
MSENENENSRTNLIIGAFLGTLCEKKVNSSGSENEPTGSGLYVLEQMNKSRKLADQWLRGMVANVHLLIPEIDDVPRSIFKYDWTKNPEDQDLVASYLLFLRELTFLHTRFVVPTFQILLKKFILGGEDLNQKDQIQFLHSKETQISRSVQIEEQQKNKFEPIFQMIHHVLIDLIKKVPNGERIFTKIAIGLFPHKKHSAVIQSTYLKQMLRATKYTSNLFLEQLFVIIIERLVDLDSEIFQDDEEEENGSENYSDDEKESGNEEEYYEEEEEEDENEKEKEKKKNIFQMDEEIGNDNKNFEMEEFVEEENNIEDEYVQKLTILLEMIFQFLEKEYFLTLQNENEKVDKKSLVKQKKRLKTLYSLILELFSQTIFKFEQAKFSQFLIFYITSFKNSFVLNFIGLLFKELKDSESMYIKQNALNYLSSYLARASFIRKEVILNVLKILVEFTFEYLSYYPKLQPQSQFEEITITKAVLQRHSIFYSLCQAIFYLLIFVAKFLTSNFQDNSVIQEIYSLHLSKLIQCPLNPLLVCSRPVVKEFIKLCKKLNIIDSKAINMALKIDQTNIQLHYIKKLRKKFTFPFDPIDFKPIEKYINPIFRTWEQEDENYVNNENENENINNSNINFNNNNENEYSQYNYSNFNNNNNNNNYLNYNNGNENTIEKEEDEYDEEDDEYVKENYNTNESLNQGVNYQRIGIQIQQNKEFSDEEVNGNSLSFSHSFVNSANDKFDKQFKFHGSLSPSYWN